MVLPALLGGMLAGSSAFNTIYASGKAYDNWKYWRDYQRNTGVHVKYPWRAGLYDNMSWGARGMRSGAMLGYTGIGLYNFYKK